MLRLTLEEVIVKKPTIQDLKTVVEQFEYIDWHGEYQGRFYYKGIAVSCEDLADVATLMVEMREDGFDLPKWDHQDNLGLGYIAAWRPSVFATETLERTAAPDAAEDDDDRPMYDPYAAVPIPARRA